MAKGLAHLEVVKGRVHRVEPDVVGAKIAKPLMVLRAQRRVALDHLQIRRREVGRHIDLVRLVGGKLSLQIGELQHDLLDERPHTAVLRVRHEHDALILRPLL